MIYWFVYTIKKMITIQKQQRKRCKKHTKYDQILRISEWWRTFNVYNLIFNNCSIVVYY